MSARVGTRRHTSPLEDRLQAKILSLRLALHSTIKAHFVNNPPLATISGTTWVIPTLYPVEVQRMENIRSILFWDADRWLWFSSHESLGSGQTTIQRQLICNP